MAILTGIAVVAGVAGWMAWRSPAEDELPQAQKIRAALPAFTRYNRYVEDTYVLANAHYSELQYIPCYCGCGGVGHRSNADCYLASNPNQGDPQWVSHAAT